MEKRRDTPVSTGFPVESGGSLTRVSMRLLEACRTFASDLAERSTCFSSDQRRNTNESAAVSSLGRLVSCGSFCLVFACAGGRPASRLGPGPRQKGRKERRQEGREEGPPAEAGPQNRVHHRRRNLALLRRLPRRQDHRLRTARRHLHASHRRRRSQADRWRHGF